MSQLPKEVGVILVSSGLWGALDLYVKIHERNGLLYLNFFPSEKHLRVKQVLKSRITFLRGLTVFVVVHTAFCFVSLIVKFGSKGEVGDDLGNIGQTFLTFYIATLFSCMMATSVILSFWSEILCTMINTVSFMEERVSDISDKTNTSYPKSNKMLEHGLTTSLKLIYFIVPTLASVVILFDLDPAISLLPPLYPLTFPSLTAFVLRLTIILILATDIVKSAWFMLLMSLILLTTVMEWSRQMQNIVQNDTINHNKVIRTYREMLVWINFVNQEYCDLAIPPLICFGMGTLILTNYGTIQLYGALPAPLYALMPITSLNGLPFLAIILPTGSMVHVVATRFKEKLRWKLREKYEHRLFRSLKTMAVNIYKSIWKGG
ncbi:hypothetical protein Fcan01_17955 [Folsomia candida]|uniref:Uncharacterized protein n=1 Tax=Folsomia candida TaxID=158441 RepID=A0A226DRR8_FOLCA|nr:hypothetical protein Fcan01_17955 [Folsomia candida]